MLDNGINVMAAIIKQLRQSEEELPDEPEGEAGLIKPKKHMTKSREAELLFEEIVEIAKRYNANPTMFEGEMDLSFDYLADLSGLTVGQCVDRLVSAGVADG